MILSGFDVNQFMERCSTMDHRRDICNALFQAQQEYKEAFGSGKALTALISSAARRRNVKLAQLFWEWMDEAGVPKNTFHYNSMISATEKSRNFRQALALMKEMERRGIAKNEVT